MSDAQAKWGGDADRAEVMQSLEELRENMPDNPHLVGLLAEMVNWIDNLSREVRHGRK